MVSFDLIFGLDSIIVSGRGSLILFHYIIVVLDENLDLKSR